MVGSFARKALPTPLGANDRIRNAPPLIPAVAECAPDLPSLPRNKNGMNRKFPQSTTTAEASIRSPAYPWTGHELLAALRAELAEEEHTDAISFHRLAEIAGTSKSTAHHRLALSGQPQVVAFFCWLERLPPPRRHAYIDAHCRLLPSLEHPLLAHATAQTSKLGELLHQQRGLTLLVGGTAYTRAFLVTALAHSFRHTGGRRQAVAGIDLHFCSNLVPAESLVYVDSSSDANLIRQVALNVWPRILTSSARLLLFHGLWSALPELRRDIIRCARHRHVILAETTLSDLAGLENPVPAPLHVLTVSVSRGVPAAIRVTCQGLKTAPKGRKTGVVGKKTVQDIGQFSFGRPEGSRLSATDAPH